MRSAATSGLRHTIKPLPGVHTGTDLGQVGLVEEGSCRSPLLTSLLHRGAFNAVIQPIPSALPIASMLAFVTMPRSQTTITVEPEAPLQLLDLGGQGLVREVAREDLDRDRAPFGRRAARR